MLAAQNVESAAEAPTIVVSSPRPSDQLVGGAAEDFEAFSAHRRAAQRERERDRQREPNRTDNNRIRERASMLDEYLAERSTDVPRAGRVRGPSSLAVGGASAAEALTTPTSATSTTSSVQPIRPFPFASVSRSQATTGMTSTRMYRSSPSFDALQSPYYPPSASSAVSPSEASFETLRARLESFPQPSAHFAISADGTPIGPSSVSIRPPHSAIMLSDGTARSGPRAGGEGATSYPRYRDPSSRSWYGHDPTYLRRRARDVVDREAALTTNILDEPEILRVARHEESSLTSSSWLGLTGTPLVRSPSPLPPIDDNNSTIPPLTFSNDSNRREDSGSSDSAPPQVVDLIIPPNLPTPDAPAFQNDIP